MADQAAQAEPAADAAAPAKKKSGALIAGIAIGGVVLGAGAGVFVVAPRIAPAAAVADTTVKAEPKKGAEGESVGKIVRLDNMVVNPAGSQGTRFLMASVAYEVADGETEKMLHDHEIQIRDQVIAVLSSQPLDSLTQGDSRGRLKEKLADVVRPMLPKGAPLHVYLPQFVIQ